MPSFKNQRYHLSRKFSPSPFIIVFILFSAVFLTGVKNPAGATEKIYVGSAVCAECHEKEYESFTTFSKKAHSFDSLLGLKKGLTEAEFQSCFECHTTGYGKPGGFSSAEETPELSNLGCESCHGPGSLHRESEDPEDIIKKVSIEHCTHCHNEERVAAFDFKPLVHGGAH